MGYKDDIVNKTMKKHIVKILELEASYTISTNTTKIINDEY